MYFSCNGARMAAELPTLFNRWQTESQFQFQRVTEGEEAAAAVPAGSSASAASAGWERYIDDESNSPYWWNAVTGESSWEEPAGAACGSVNNDETEVAATTTVTAAAAAAASGAACATTRHRRKMPQTKAVRFSRSLPDSAFANKFGRPVFHNFGRANEKLKSFSQRVGLETAAHKPEQTEEDTADEEAAATAAVAETQAERVDEAVESGCDTRGADVPETTELAGVGSADAAQQQQQQQQQSEDENVDLDPKSYKYLPPHWVLQIRAAGMASSRTSSVSDCLQQFL